MYTPHGWLPRFPLPNFLLVFTFISFAIKPVQFGEELMKRVGRGVKPGRDHFLKADQIRTCSQKDFRDHLEVTLIPLGECMIVWTHRVKALNIP